MNEYQKVGVELLKVFIDICEKLDLRYYMACGSVLGAVKYQGFIPWDDDIDVCLVRPDYEIFVNEASKYLPEYLFLQNYKTDRNYPSVTSKIRDSRTTWIEKGVAHLDINHGIYLDIFPIDGYPNTLSEQKRFERKKMHFERVRAISYKSKINPMAVRTNLTCVANKLFGIYSSSQKNICQYERLIASYAPGESRIWCNHGNWQGKLEYADNLQYGKGTWAIFEGLKVRIPEKYDEYLTQKYGNWRENLPPEQQNSGHSLLYKDISKSYKCYIKNK